MIMIENASVLAKDSYFQITAHIKDQDGDIIQELGRGRCVMNALVYEGENYTIYLFTEDFESKKSNIISTILNSKFGYSLGETIGKGLPEIINALGKQRVEELINKFIE